MNQFFLQAAGGAGSFTPLIFMVGMFAVMYFFMIRPQQKKAKEQRIWVGNLKKGDKVVTVSGIHGTISQVSEDNPVVVVEIAVNTNVKMDKSAISLDMTKAGYPTA
ncbi:MAG: preprotein translocase subunit YajC [Chitinophagales bacterium]|nr:preprotein translocase subunit YajC [Chitinophagales bacterium]MCZ2394041.1 preprotein translocase subunit YajC [Chitinophagales bacterium]